MTRCAQVIGKGSGMPQLFNDEAVIPALKGKGISDEDARNYAIVGCVELTTMGNNLGWSDAAMFNLVKALELALNDGVCTLTGKQMGAHTGTIEQFTTYEDVLNAFETQVNFFFERMIRCCEVVERAHAELLPSPFLSCVIDDCMERGIDVTAGGAHYNLSGIQAIQCANVADSLAALKTLVYDEQIVSREELHAALVNNFENAELLRLRMLNKAPKYGNDIDGWTPSRSTGQRSLPISSRATPTYAAARTRWGSTRFRRMCLWGRTSARLPTGARQRNRSPTAACPPCTDGTAKVPRRCSRAFPASRANTAATARC